MSTSFSVGQVERKMEKSEDEFSEGFSERMKQRNLTEGERIRYETVKIIEFQPAVKEQPKRRNSVQEGETKTKLQPKIEVLRSENIQEVDPYNKHLSKDNGSPKIFDFYLYLKNQTQKNIRLDSTLFIDFGSKFIRARRFDIQFFVEFPSVIGKPKENLEEIIPSIYSYPFYVGLDALTLLHRFLFSLFLLLLPSSLPLLPSSLPSLPFFPFPSSLPLLLSFLHPSLLSSSLISKYH